MNEVDHVVVVGIYRVSSSDRTPKGHRSQTDHRSIHQYFDVVKTLREGNSPRPAPTWLLQAIY